MVLHDGDLSMYKGYSKDDITYQYTQEELQQIDIGDGQRMPTLEEFIQFYEDSPNMLLNFDLKYSGSAEYDAVVYAQRVVDLIEKYDIGKKTVVESGWDYGLRIVIE